MALLIDSRVYGFNSGLIDLQPSGVTLITISSLRSVRGAPPRNHSADPKSFQIRDHRRTERSFPAKESRTSRSPFGQHDERGDALPLSTPYKTANDDSSDKTASSRRHQSGKVMCPKGERCLALKHRRSSA